MTVEMPCSEPVYINRCVYCGDERGGKFGCCGEVHFQDEPQCPICSEVVEFDGGVPRCADKNCNWVGDPEKEKL